MTNSKMKKIMAGEYEAELSGYYVRIIKVADGEWSAKAYTSKESSFPVHTYTDSTRGKAYTTTKVWLAFNKGGQK